jgi:hypothetical protein
MFHCRLASCVFDKVCVRHFVYHSNLERIVSIFFRVPLQTRLPNHLV